MRRTGLRCLVHKTTRRKGEKKKKKSAWHVAGSLVVRCSDDRRENFFFSKTSNSKMRGCGSGDVLCLHLSACDRSDLSVPQLPMHQPRLHSIGDRHSGRLCPDPIPFNCITGRIALVASVISLTAPVQLVIPTHRAYVTCVLVVGEGATVGEGGVIHSRVPRYSPR